MNQFESEKLLNKIRNVFGIPEFQPIIEMSETWFSKRDETKYEKSNKELLDQSMDTTWLSMGLVQQFTCFFVTKYDFMENTEKAKCWAKCVTNYLKNSK